MGSVGRSESVVDVDVAETCELLGDVAVVGLFAAVEAEVFEQQDVTLRKPGGKALYFFPKAIRSDSYLTAQEFSKPSRDRAELHFRVCFPVGPP